MWYAYSDGRYIVMSRQGPMTDRAADDCVASFDTKEEALAWAGRAGAVGDLAVSAPVSAGPRAGPVPGHCRGGHGVGRPGFAGLPGPAPGASGGPRGR